MYAADIRPKEAFAAFAEAHKLHDVDVWRQPVKPVQYSYANGPLARIAKDGMMLRQAGTVSTFWRSCTCSDSSINRGRQHALMRSDASH